LVPANAQRVERSDDLGDVAAQAPVSESAASRSKDKRCVGVSFGLYFDELME
jgi:hypothetical protein